MKNKLLLLQLVWRLQSSDSSNKPQSWTSMPQRTETVYTPCTQKCFRWQSWGKNKQTNKHAAQCEATCTRRSRLHLYLLPVKAVGLLPLTRTFPLVLLLGTKPPLCEPALGSWSGRTLSRLHRGYDWGHPGKLRLEREVGGLGGVGGGKPLHTPPTSNRFALTNRR